MKDKDYEKLFKAKNQLVVRKNNLGKAGEYLTAGKLLLNGFNVYTSAIDDGIDLVAKKSKRFYYIQVKTCQDIEYDSGKFVASINLSTLNRHPLKQTFVVLVLHYLGPTASPDNMGDHNTYDQLFIVLPLDFLSSIFEANTGKATCRIFCSLIMDNPQEGNWIVKLKFKGKEIILDDFLIDSFWQLEI